MIENVRNLKQSLINFVKKPNAKSKLKKIKKNFPIVYKKIKKMNIDYVKLKSYNENELVNIFQTNSQTALILKQMLKEELNDDEVHSVPHFSQDQTLIQELNEEKVNYLEIDKVISILTKSNQILYYEKNYSLTTKLIEMNISFYKLIFFSVVDIISTLQIPKKDAFILYKLLQDYLKSTVQSIENQSGYFIGQRINLKFYGLCLYYFSNGDQLVGIVKNNLQNGVGKLIAKCGDKYKGEYKDGLKHGYGIYEWANGDIYEGEWKDNLRSGYGIYITKNGFTYEGEWKNNEKNGIGLFHNKNDTNHHKDICFYSGQWKENVKSGYGYSQRNNEIYEGEFRNMNKDGYGSVDYGNGERYEGQFKNGFKERYGKLYFDGGESIYIGEMKKGQKSGYGICTFKNGNVYQGDWLYDKYHGKGVLRKQDSIEPIEGNWENGVFID